MMNNLKSVVLKLHENILEFLEINKVFALTFLRILFTCRSNFNLNRDKYIWQKRLDATIYECNSQKNAELVYKLLKKKKY